MNTTSSASQNITSGLVIIESGGIPATRQTVIVTSAGEAAQQPGRSRRRSAESAQREADDPVYRERKRVARAALAEEMANGRPPASLSEVRLRRGLSQTDLAAMTGMTQPHIAKIEARKLGIQLVTARKMAAALGITVDELASLVLPLEQDTNGPQATTASHRVVIVENK